MSEYISKAFKTLKEEFNINIEEPVYLKEEDEENNSSKTILDLLKDDSSFNIIYDFDVDGENYSLYIESTCDGESCDSTFGEFHDGDINGVIIDVLDGEKNFIGTVKEVDINSPIDEVIEKSKNVINGEEKAIFQPEVSDEVKDEEEEPEVNERIFLGGKDPEEKSEEEPKDEVGAEIEPEPETNTDKEDDIPEDEPKKEEDLKVINESKSFDIMNKDDIEEANATIDEKEDTEGIEKIVDVNAESVDDLKKTYIGSIVLRCPTCGTMIYKNPEDLVKSDEDENVYNVDDECPHCGSKDGYELIGQVATLDTNPEATPEPPMVEDEPKMEEKPEEPKDEPKEEEIPPSEDINPDEATEISPEDVKEEIKEEVKPCTNCIEKEKDFILESLDEGSFDRLVKRYLNETYSNIKSYRTTDASIDDANNKIVLEGKITFKSGKEKDTKFMFEARELTKKGKIKFSGINETFSNKKSYTLLGDVKSNKLLSESLTYNYKVNESKVTGRVCMAKKR